MCNGSFNFSSFMVVPAPGLQWQLGLFMQDCFYFLFILHVKNLINLVALHLPLEINTKVKHSSLSAGICLSLPPSCSPPASVNLRLSLTHPKLCKFGHKSHFLSGLNVPSGCSSECQLNCHIVY